MTKPFTLRYACVVLAWLAGADAASGAKLEAISGIPAIRNPGEVAAYRYVPDSVAAEAPLIVLLHGCQQTAAEFARAGWVDLAERSGSILLLPEQRSANNPYACWNWFLADDLIGRGEMTSIVNLIEHTATRYPIAADRIFVAGLSAGGWMASALLLAHPELFAGGAVFAGGPAYCAVVGNAWWDPLGWWTTWRGAREARACMAGRDRTPAAWLGLARDHAGNDSRAPRLSVWHGSEDSIVAPINVRELIEQWTALLAIDAEPDANVRLGSGGLITRRAFVDTHGRVLLEEYLIDGMEHGIPISAACGAPAEFSIDVDFCGTEHVGQFWGLLPGPP